MSDLGQIKQQIAQFGQSARAQSQALSAFKPKFAEAAALVNAKIGSTATGADDKIIAALQDAQKRVDEAINALGQAAAEAARYAATA